jgi:nicotinamide-nucleotide amidase
LKRNIVVSDDAESIGQQFEESWARSDLVITTGGLGPTCDDRTREVIAGILGQKLVRDADAERAIRERFASFRRQMTDNNLKQAYRPEGGVLLPNPNGTAPGIWVEQDGRILVMLPGPPSELIPMFESEVLPRLEARGYFPEKRSYIQIRTAGIGESALETRLSPIMEENPSVEVAFCAHQGQVDVRLSSQDARLSNGRLQIVANRCREALGLDFVCFGEDSLVKVVSDMLRHRDFTLAVAESCTGGLLSNNFTDLGGASKFFAGGVTCYNNDCKVQLLNIPECLIAQHGAVSAVTAVAMATGAAELLETSHGLSTTGFAGPCGGTAENPVGTIYLGLHTPHGVWSRRVSYPGSRLSVKQRAVNSAIDWLRRDLIRSAVTQHGKKPNAIAKHAEEAARFEGQNLFGLSG